jgi:hypothetical protein
MRSSDVGSLICRFVTHTSVIVTHVRGHPVPNRADLQGIAIPWIGCGVVAASPILSLKLVLNFIILTSL